MASALVRALLPLLLLVLSRHIFISFLFVFRLYRRIVFRRIFAV